MPLEPRYVSVDSDRLIQGVYLTGAHARTRAYRARDRWTADCVARGLVVTNNPDSTDTSNDSVLITAVAVDPAHPELGPVTQFFCALSQIEWEVA